MCMCVYVCVYACMYVLMLTSFSILPVFANLVSLRVFVFASQWAACHLPHGGLAYKIFSPTEQESQAVDPGME